ncbi:MAG: DUF4129 domain-containing protein [Myxococcaceae bacterium]|nr:DUF4129 domain-containing protein [Myxococcaceae bacterium]
MIAAASIALLIATGAADVPRAPCDAQEEVRTALEAAAAQGRPSLDAALGSLERLLEFPLLRGTDPKDPQRVELALARLGSLCAARAQTPTARAISPADPALLQEILSRPEFADARDRRGDAFAALIRRVTEWLESLFQTREMETGAKWIRFFVLALAAALALFGLLRLRSARLTKRSRPVSDGSAPGPLVLDDPAVHLARAREALADDARRAIREGLLALLSMLERQRWARPDRVKTNRELSAELPGRGAPTELAVEVDALVRWYDRTFYSLAPVPAAEARHFVDSIAALSARIGAGAAG